MDPFRKHCHDWSPSSARAQVRRRRCLPHSKSTFMVIHGVKRSQTDVRPVSLQRCDMSNPAAPKPCVLMFGGQSATGLLNDLYALWITETPMRWELITADTATPAAGQPSRRANAVGAASADGGTLFVYGGGELFRLGHLLHASPATDPLPLFVLQSLPLARPVTCLLWHLLASPMPLSLR